MSEWFHVGQKVVCVDAEWFGGGQSARGIPCPLVVGKIYEIEAIAPLTGIFKGRDVKGHLGLVLKGVRKPRVLGVRTSDTFAAWRFRPVREKKTDISIFRRLLVTPPKQGVDA